MSRYVQSSNPFENDDEDDGDFVMVNKSGKTSSGSGYNSRKGTSNAYSSNNYWNASGETSSPFDDRRQQIVRQIENSENTQLESTQRALASIYDSEAMGVATAEELIRQGETLDNIEKKTDGMQQDLKTSQRHLNNIKSVFGGIKNWWSGEKKSQESSKSQQNDSNSRLRSTVEKSEKQKADYSGFYDDDPDLDSKFMANAPKSRSQSGPYSMISPVTRSAREQDVDENLGLMFDGMTRLKGLAMGLGDEIERQNEQLDKINDKVGTTDDLLQNQNVQMRRILKR